MSHSMAAIAVGAVLSLLVVAVPSQASNAADGRSVAEYWTTARMADAIPRDLVVDEQGRGHLRLPNGSLQPYGNQTPTADGSSPQSAADPRVKPTNPGGGGGGGGGNDAEGPTVTAMDPADGTTLTASSHTFWATVTDGSGVKSVTFHITPEGGTTSSLSASLSGDRWEASVTGLTTGAWSWSVEARDGAKRGGNTSTTGPVGFTVDTGTDDGGGDGGSTGDLVTNAEWTAGGAVQTAAGRIYFEMPDRGAFWSGYVCSGTVATDGTTGRSIIITAAHCVYDDANKVFARNVLFIPDQAGTTASGTNTTCSDDPMGCWAPSHGVVDDDWANRTWPDNIPWDYAYYVVPDGAHTGTRAEGWTGVLDADAGSLPVQFDPAATSGAYTHALGYSYSEDPKFMFCAEGLSTDANYGSNWLGDCGLSGGASGGPWVQPMDTSTGWGPIVSVNSYGYSNQPGMGAPHLTGSASCVFDAATSSEFDNDRGIVVGCG